MSQRNPNRVLIEIRRGMIACIHATHDCEVLVLDQDTLENGGACSVEDVLDGTEVQRVSNREFGAILRKHRENLDRALSEEIA